MADEEPRKRKRRKRGNGEGSVYQKPDGRWCAQVSLGKDTVSGRPIRKTVYGSSQAEVLQKKAALIQEYANGQPQSRVRVKDLLGFWLAACSHRVSPESLSIYTTEAAPLMTYLGDKVAAELTSWDVARAQDKMIVELGVPGTRRALTVLRRALKYATDMALIRDNVARRVPLPKYRSRKGSPLTPERAAILIQAARGSRLEALVTLALDTGCRQGELFALEWTDWNPATGVLSITKNLAEHPRTHERRVKEPKTESSTRNILLSPLGNQALHEHRARQAAEGYGGPLVFPTAGGIYLRKDHFRKRFWVPLLKKAGLPGLRFHDLRHTTASVLLGAGLSVKVVADRLGHGDAATTLNVYAHSLPHLHSRAAEVMGGLLAGCSKNAVLAVPKSQQNEAPSGSASTARACDRPKEEELSGV
jgi:integrase